MGFMELMLTYSCDLYSKFYGGIVHTASKKGRLVNLLCDGKYCTGNSFVLLKKDLDDQTFI